MPTRILFATGVFPPLLGGPATITNRLARELTKSGYQCTVLTFGNRNSGALPFQVKRVSYRIPQPFRGFLMMLKTIQEARSADIIYAFDTYTSGYAAAIAARLLKKPLLVRFTGDAAWEQAYADGRTSLDILSFQKNPPRTRSFRMRRFILNTANLVVTDCIFLKNVLSAMGISDSKVRVINNATDQHEQALIESNTIIAMGRLVKWKGVEALIRVFPKVKKHIPNAALVIAGTGPEEQHLQTIAKKISPDDILFTGAIFGKEKNTCFNNAGVFVLNTFYEGMSNTLLEAMAYGLPIITTNAGANEELIQHEANGIVINYNDQDALARGLIELLSNKNKARQLGNSARNESQRYDWEQFVKQNKKIIEELL